MHSSDDPKTSQLAFNSFHARKEDTPACPGSRNMTAGPDPKVFVFGIRIECVIVTTALATIQEA